MGPGDDVTPQIEGYQIGRRIGRGGMGTVWSATHLGTRQVVALKVMNMATVGCDKAKGWFEREIKLAARLDHPNIAPVYDTGVARGKYFYTMKLIDGVPLDRYVEKFSLTRRQILELMRCVCHAVEHAHQRRVIHCDLKPSNILVTDDGVPYVVDYGLAEQIKDQLSEEDLDASPREDHFAGTLAYMAPEQADKDKPLDTRTDVYSLGVILYRLLTGCFPHNTVGTHEQVRRRILLEEPPPPHVVCKEIDRELSMVVATAVGKEPTERYASAGALRRDLDHYLAGDPLDVWPASVVYLLAKLLRKHRLMVGAAAAVVLCAIVLATVAYQRERHLRREAQEARLEAEAKAEDYRRALYLNTISSAQSAYDQGLGARARELLGACPQDLRHWEWRHLQGLLDQSHATLAGHDQAVLAVAYDALGERLVTVDAGWVLVRDAHDGGIKSRVKIGGQGRDRVVAVSGDARRAALYSRGEIRIRDLSDGGVIQHWKPRGDVAVIQLSQDGRRLAVGSEGRIELYETESGELIQAFDGVSGAVKALAFSRDGRRLAAGGTAAGFHLGGGGLTLQDAAGGQKEHDGWLRLWELKPSGGEPCGANLLGAMIESLAFSPDGDRLAVGGWDQVVVVDPIDASVLATLDGAGSCLAFSPDGKLLAAGGSGGGVSLWAAASHRLISARIGHRNEVNCLAFSPDGSRIVTGGDDAAVKLWARNRAVDRIEAPPPYSGVAAVSTDADWVLHTDACGSLQLVDTDTGRVRRHPWMSAYQINPPSGVWIPLHVLGLPVYLDLDIVMDRLWDAGGGLVGQEGWLLESALVSGDGGLVFGVWRGRGKRSLTAWDTGLGEVERWCESDARITNLHISPQGDKLAASIAKQIHLWDLKTRVATVLDAGPGKVRSIAISPDGRRVVTAADDGVARVWDAASGAAAASFAVDQAVLTHVGYSPDNRRIIVGTMDGRMSLIDAQDGKIIASFRGHEDHMTFSPCGRMLAIDGPGVITILDVDTGSRLLEWNVDFETRRVLAFSPDGRRLFSAGESGAVTIWDVEAGVEVMTLQAAAMRGRVTGLRVSGDGEKVLCLSELGSAFVWRGRAPTNQTMTRRDSVKD